MTLEEMIEEFRKGTLFGGPPTESPQRKDLYAFNLLNQLVPPTSMAAMVACAEHDEIWLDVDPEELARVITVEQITELRMCGVRYDTSNGSLAMFV